MPIAGTGEAAGQRHHVEGPGMNALLHGQGARERVWRQRSFAGGAWTRIDQADDGIHQPDDLDDDAYSRAGGRGGMPARLYVYRLIPPLARPRTKVAKPRTEDSRPGD